MKPEKKNKHFIKKAYYEGGMKALRAFIAKNLQYPEEALKNKVEGTVFIKYTIDHHGRVIESKIISSLGYGCDEEAQRLLSLLRFKVPKNRGVKIKFHKSIQIHFHLPKTLPSKKLQYHYTTESPAKDSQPVKSGSYNYTIPISKK